MSNSLKAAIYSALVFPGMGHFYLKKYVQGSVFFGLAAACLYFIMTTVITVSKQVVSQLTIEDLPLDTGKVTELVQQAMAMVDGSAANTAIWVLIVIWLVSTLDAARLGRSVEGENVD